MSCRALCELASESHRLLPRLAAKAFVRLHTCVLSVPEGKAPERVEGEPHALVRLLIHRFAKVFMHFFFGKRCINTTRRESKFGTRSNNFPIMTICSFPLRRRFEGQHWSSVVLCSWPSFLPVCVRLSVTANWTNHSLCVLLLCSVREKQPSP